MDGINSTVVTPGYTSNSSVSKPQSRDKSLAEALTNPKTAGTSALLLVLMVMIVGGNTLVCRTVFVTRRLHFSAFYFVASLAVADMSVGLFLIPFSIAYTVMGEMKGGEWSFSPALCHVGTLCNFWFCSASVLNLCVVSWDRYVAVTSPLVYTVRMHHAKVRWLIAAIWLSSLVLSVLITIAVVLSDRVIYCTASGIDLKYSILAALFIFVLPLMFLIFANGKIMLIARAQMRKILKEMPAHYSFDSSEESSSKSRTEHSKDGSKTGTRGREKNNYFARFRREVKTFKLFVVVTGVFVTCWTPMFVAMVTSSVINTVLLSAIMHFLLIMGYANSACNIFIYGYFNQDFRRAILSSLHYFKCCRHDNGNHRRGRSVSQRYFANNNETEEEPAAHAQTVETQTSFDTAL